MDRMATIHEMAARVESDSQTKGVCSCQFRLFLKLASFVAISGISGILICLICGWTFSSPLSANKILISLVAGLLLGIATGPAVAAYSVLFKIDAYRKGLKDGINSGIEQGFQMGYKSGLQKGMKVEAEIRFEVPDPQMRRDVVNLIFYRMFKKAS